MLTIGCVLPIMVMVTFVMLTDYQRGQAQVAENTLSRARAVTSAVDREFGNTQAALLALATSPQLAKNDLAAFHTQAKAALLDIDGAKNITVMDRTGQILLTTDRLFGAVLPSASSPGILQRILSTGKPSVSDLYFDLESGDAAYTIAVPLKHDGAIIYLLSATLSTAQLLAVLTEQNFPGSWRASIIDSSASIVARTHEMKQLLGKKVVPELLERVRYSTEGSIETKTLDGIPVMTVFARSTLTGWTVAIGAPLDELKASIRQALAQTLAVTLLALGIGFALAWLVGGRIASAFIELIKPAKALGAGEAVTVQRLPINEANEVGEALLDAARLLDQANRAKADFLSNMSHELRTPLNAILGFAQLMEASSPPPTDSQNKSLSQILTAGWHLLELVDEVLNLSLIDSGKLAPSLDSVSLAEVILESKVMVEPNAKKASINLMFPHFKIPYLVCVDRSWLNQCLINLLSNAIKYNKPNGVVVVECEQSSSDSVRIIVRDSGAGLTPQQLARVFQPFNQLGSQPGIEKRIGTSLMVTKRLVELMGGNMGADSTLGAGSIFWIEFKLTAIGSASTPTNALALTR
jgi:signal transduction histidine kinase